MDWQTFVSMPLTGRAWLTCNFLADLVWHVIDLQSLVGMDGSDLQTLLGISGTDRSLLLTCLCIPAN